MSRRVLILTPSVRMLGARHSLLLLARGLDRARYEPEVVCPAEGDLTRHLADAGITYHCLPLPPWRKGRSWLRMPAVLVRLRRIVRDRNPALLHANEPYPVPHALIGAQGRPVVAHVRLEANPSLARKYWLSKAARVACVSQAVRDSMAGSRPASWHKNMIVVHNGLEADDFTAGIDAAAMRSQGRAALGIADDALVLGQFGLLSDRKRHRDVLAALARLSPEEARRVVYLVIGAEGPRNPGYAERLHEDALKLDLDITVEKFAPKSDDPVAVGGHHQLGQAQSFGEERIQTRARVIFLGFRTRIAPWYSVIDALTLPSDQEGFGRVILEAAAFEKPTLGSNAGGIPEVIRDGQTGWLHQVGDIDSWAATIRGLLADPTRMTARGAAACEVLQRDFSNTAHSRAIMKLYDDVLAS